MNATKCREPTLELPIAEDTPSIQISIIQIMRGDLPSIDNKTAGILLYALQLSTTNLTCERDVFPPPPPEEDDEEDNRHKSLVEILLERLREDPPNPVPAEEHQPIFRQPPPSFPGYPEMPPPAGFRREAKTEESANTSQIRRNT